MLIMLFYNMSRRATADNGFFYAGEFEGVAGTAGLSDAPRVADFTAGANVYRDSGRGAYSVGADAGGHRGGLPAGGETVRWSAAAGTPGV